MGQPDDLRQLLIHLEQRLHDPLVRRGPAEVAALLADEFQEFGRSGRVYDKAAMLGFLATEPDPLAPLEAAGFVLHCVSPGAALLTYRSIRAGETTLRASLWVRRDERWRMLFHQGTPVRS